MTGKQAKFDSYARYMMDLIPQGDVGIGIAEVPVDITKAFAVKAYSDFIEATPEHIAREAGGW
jgi:hypothetical protein